MNEFKIGDEVIALSSAKRPNQPRTKGRIYTITSIFYCSTDGKQMVNIDYTKSVTRKLRCGCGKYHHTGDNRSYTYSTNFVKPEDLDARREQAVEEEDYDTAILCRNLIDRKNATD